MVRSILARAKRQTRRAAGLEYVNAYSGALAGESPLGPLGFRGPCPSDYYVRDKARYRRSPGQRLDVAAGGPQPGVAPPSGDPARALHSGKRRPLPDLPPLEEDAEPEEAGEDMGGAHVDLLNRLAWGAGELPGSPPP